MNKLLIALVVSLVSLPAFSYDYNYGDNSSDGDSSSSYGTDNNSNDSSYESSTGTKYQYDTSSPSDNVEYGVDVDAQMRDEISVNPSRGLDRSMGQYGGGIYDD